MKSLLTQFAQRINTGEGQGEVDIPTIQGPDLFANILFLVYFAAGAVAVIVIIIAGIQFVTAAGDPGKAKAARNKVLFAGIGLIVVLAAFALTNFVIGRF